MFDRFTDDARHVVVYAQEECWLLGHKHIGTEHLLLGLLHDATPTGAALEAAGVTLADARATVEQSQGRRNKEPHGHIPFTPRAKRVLEESLRQAQRLGQENIARPHLLCGLLAVRDGIGAQTLVQLGVDLNSLAARADELALAIQPEGELDSSTGIRAEARPRTAVGKVPRRLRYRRGSESSEDLAAQLGELAARREALADAVRRYARHDEDCDRDQRCTCGLQQVLDGLDRPASG